MFVWDVERASVGETLEGHAGKITGLTISRDGSTLYTSAYDGKVLVWDLGGAAPSRPHVRQPDSDGDAPRYALSPDGRDLAIGGVDGTITLIDARTLQTRSSFPVVAEGPVRGMGYVPGGTLLVVGGDDGFLALVDPARGRIVKRLSGQREHGLHAQLQRRRPDHGDGQRRPGPALRAAVGTARRPSVRSARPRSRTCRSAPTAARWR